MDNDYTTELMSKKDDLKGVYGYADHDKKKIVLDPSKGDLVNTIIHENLHANNPNKSESTVIDQSAKIESKLDIVKQRDLLNQTIQKINESESSLGGVSLLERTQRTTASKVISSVTK